MNTNTMSTSALVKRLKEAEQDFEFYPTTPEMLSEAFKALMSIKKYNQRILDIGCGTCAFKKYIEAQGDTDNHFGIEYYGIEKSEILLKELPKDVFIAGTDFNETTLIDKQVDFIFCNPPYSEYENWTNRIIREGNFRKAVLVIPERWKTNERIKASLEAASTTYEVMNHFDFLNGERVARAKVDVVCFTKQIDEYTNQSPFDMWFEETFGIKQTEGEGSLYEKSEKKEILKRDVIVANNKIEKLVNLYNADMGRLSSSFAAICSIDETLLKDIGVNYISVKKALQDKIKNQKVLYWGLVFDCLDELTSRLTQKTRGDLFDKFRRLNCVDFNERNIRAVVLWAIKNASDYYSQQLIKFYKNLSETANVRPYKSNINAFVKDSWRFYRGEKYVLDYRIISSALFAAKIGWSGEFDRLNESVNEGVINDFCAIARNLGFTVGKKEVATDFNKKYYVYMSNGKPLFEYKIYKNGNTHIKLNIELSKAINVEVARLLGWIRDKSDIKKEFPDEMGEGAEKYFHQNFSVCLERPNIKLLGGF